VLIRGSIWLSVDAAIFDLFFWSVLRKVRNPNSVLMVEDCRPVFLGGFPFDVLSVDNRSLCQQRLDFAVFKVMC
jgi:hypothetical protein